MYRLMIALLGSTAMIAPALAQTGSQPQQQPMIRTETGQAQGAQPMTVQGVTNQPIYRENGQEFGRVNRVVRADNGQIFLVAMAGNRMVMVPAGLVTMQGNRLTMRASDEQLGALAVYREGMSGYRPVAANESLNIVGQQQGQLQPGSQTGQSADGSRIVVQQAAPQIRVEQAPPEVAIQQAQPNVTVRQPQPEITVRQPPAIVTVDIPQPEIIVRMPQPEVAVTVPQPQVQVRQTEPQIQVVQPQQPQVEIDRAPQPQVTVQPAQPQVTLQQTETQPRISYERAEPQVRVNQGQGQPTVRFEQAAPGEPSGTAGLQTGSVGTQTGSVQNAPVPPVRPSNGQALSAQDLINRNIYNLQGEQMGDVDRVLVGQGGRTYLVVGHGGFLGLGEKQILLPAEQIRISGERLVMPGLTNDQIRTMPEFNATNAANYQDAADTHQTNILLHQ